MLERGPRDFVPLWGPRFKPAFPRAGSVALAGSSTGLRLRRRRQYGFRSAAPTTLCDAIEVLQAWWAPWRFPYAGRWV